MRLSYDRWHLVAPPAENQSQGYQMHLVAREDIPQGQELLLSYGDRNNDDFFLHYGFVPLRNPHDDTVLFQDLIEALDWHYDQFPPQVGARSAATLRLTSSSIHQWNHVLWDMASNHCVH